MVSVFKASSCSRGKGAHLCRVGAMSFHLTTMATSELMPCVTSCVWCNITQLLFLMAHISTTFSDAITTSELFVALSSNLLSHGLHNVACAIQVSCVKRQKWEVGVERWQVSNLIPVACSLRTAVPGAIVRPHKYGNCCEKEGQLLSVGVVYYLRVISGFPCQLFTPRVQCCLSQVQWILLRDQQIFHLKRGAAFSHYDHFFKVIEST